MENVKLNVLADFLGELREDWTQSSYASYDENVFECGRREYLVLTDEEADEAAAEYIKETLWAFNASFIADHTRVDLNSSVTAALKRMQEELAEHANDLIEALIEDMDDFVSDAISADGRGHFLSPYDGEEAEKRGEDGEVYYIYRLN